MTLFKLLPHLPKIPEHLLSQVDEIINQGDDTVLNGKIPAGTWGRELTRDGVKFSSRRQPRWAAPDDLTEWVRINVIDGFKDVGIARNYGDNSSFGPHTDYTRYWSLLYPVRSGNSRTCFWQQKGQPLLRDPLIYCNDYSELELLDQVQIPEHTWCLLNARVVHSVEGAQGDRITVQASFDQEPFTDIK